MRPLLPLVALALTVVLCAVPVAQVADVLRCGGRVAIRLAGCGRTRQALVCVCLRRVSAPRESAGFAGHPTRTRDAGLAAGPAAARRWCPC